MLRMNMPAHSMPITRGRRSCQAMKAPIWEHAHSSSVAQAGWPGRKAVPMEKKKTACKGRGDGDGGGGGGGGPGSSARDGRQQGKPLAFGRPRQRSMLPLQAAAPP